MESRPVDAPLASLLKLIGLGRAFHTEPRLSITAEREEVGEINVLNDWKVKRATGTAESGGGLLTMPYRTISYQGLDGQTDSLLILSRNSQHVGFSIDIKAHFLHIPKCIYFS